MSAPGRWSPPASARRTSRGSSPGRLEVRAEECCRLVLAGRIAHQHPSGLAPAGCRHGTRPRCRSRPAAYAAGHCTTGRRRRSSRQSSCWPARRAGVGGRRPFGGVRPRALAFQARGGAGLYRAASSRSRSDDTDVVAHRGQQFQRSEAAVSDKDQHTVGQPAFGLQDRLTRPVSQRLVPLAVLLLSAVPTGRNAVRNGTAQLPARTQLISTTTVEQTASAVRSRRRNTLRRTEPGRDRCRAP